MKVYFEVHEKLNFTQLGVEFYNAIKQVKFDFDIESLEITYYIKTCYSENDAVSYINDLLATWTQRDYTIIKCFSNDHER